MAVFCGQPGYLWKLTTGSRCLCRFAAPGRQDDVKFNSDDSTPSCLHPPVATAEPIDAKFRLCTCPQSIRRRVHDRHGITPRHGRWRASAASRMRSELIAIIRARPTGGVTYLSARERADIGALGTMWPPGGWMRRILLEWYPLGQRRAPRDDQQGRGQDRRRRPGEGRDYRS